MQVTPEDTAMDSAHNKQLVISMDLVKPDCTPIVLSAIFASLCWTVVGLRLFSRAFILKKLGWDDYTMALALVSLLLFRTSHHFTDTQLASFYSLPLSLASWELISP
jgi:hypothetical protein